MASPRTPHLLSICTAGLLWLIAPSTPAQSITHLGQPCRSFNLLASRVVVDPKTGEDLFVLTNMNESGTELILVNHDANRGKLIKASEGEGAWALTELPGHRIAVGTFFDAAYLIYDLKREDWITTAYAAGEQYLWNFAHGPDGKLYAGTYKGGKLVSLDTNTYKVTDHGAAAPPNLYLRNLSALPDGRLLCSYETEKPTNLIFDPRNGRFAPAPPALHKVKQGVSWSGYFLAHNKVFDGKTLAPVEPPFPVPGNARQWSVNTDLTSSETLYLTVEGRLYRYRVGDGEPQPASEANLQKVRPTGVGRGGELMGRRGQDYFVVRPGDTRVELKRLPVESAPRPTLFLRVDSDGNLWGGPWFGQTLFCLNPASGVTTNTGVVTAAGGEVYDLASLNGKIYAASYAGGEIIEYDPRRPWQEFEGINPRVMTRLEGKGYIRPAGGIRVGPDGKLYSVWWSKYGVYGGALAITDPATRETVLVENPLGKQSVSGLAVDEKCAYLATSIMANGLPNKAEAPRFGVYDLECRQLVFEHTFDDYEPKTTTQSVPMVLDRGTRRLALSADGKLKLFDTQQRRWLEVRQAPRVGSFVIAAPGNGKAYYGSARAIIEIDMTSGNTRSIAELPGHVWTLDAAPDGTVYAACGIDVYRVTDY